MAILSLVAMDVLAFAGVIAGGYLLSWWIVRPLSYVYRVENGWMAVRTFFVLPLAKVKLSEISRFDRNPPSAPGKPVRWLVSPYRRWSGRTLRAETNREQIVLPDSLAGALASHTPGSGFPAGYHSQLREKTNRQRLLAGALVLNLKLRKVASACVPLSAAAAWCLILPPLWLTAVDVVGSKMFAEEFGVPLARVLDSNTWPHFAATAFVISCGIAARLLLAFGKSLSWPVAGISLFAVASRNAIGFPYAHDVLSHPLFDSCTGYDVRLSLIGIICIAGATVLALATWSSRSTPPHSSFRLTATP